MYKVLIIDDEPWARKVILSLAHFDQLNLQVIGEAEDGIKGLEMIKILGPDIVITDMRMPGLDGVGLLKEITNKYSDLLIIAMSGYNDFRYLKQAIQSRAIEYLLKPVNKDELNKALGRCIQTLNKQRKNVFNGYGTLHLFQEQKTLNKYLKKKKLVKEYLLSLDKVKISQIMYGLQLEFNCHTEWITKEVMSKVIHDFTELLEEFVVKSELDISKILNISDYNIDKENSLAPANIFNYINDLYQHTIDKIIDSKKAKQQLNIDEIVNYINKHYSEPITLESIASYFFISKEHLSRTFKANQGMTLNEYLIKIRMENAKKLLLQSELAIKDIALLVSYTDIAYFYRVFKKYWGIAPGAYRQKGTSK